MEIIVEFVINICIFLIINAINELYLTLSGMRLLLWSLSATNSTRLSSMMANSSAITPNVKSVGVDL